MQQNTEYDLLVIEATPGGVGFSFCVILSFHEDIAIKTLTKIILGIVTIVGVALSPLRGQEPDSRPNVLFIAVDDINDWVGVLGGNSQARTPNLDGLSKRGVLFTREYCAAPACNPSRVALLTGIRPSTSGMYFNKQKFRKMLPNAVTLPQHFAKQGYRVIGGGKIFHNGNPDPRSWQWYLKHQLDPIDRGASQKELPGNYRWKPINEGGDEAMGDYQVVRWTEQEFAKAPVKPTFMAVGLYRPHMPWMVPKKYFDQYPLESIKLPKTNPDDLADLPSAGRWFATHRGFHEKIVRLDQWKSAVRGYLASIAFSDAMLGQLLDAFDKSPWKDNTIIVLWGDHGMHLGKKQHWTKYALWEKSTRTPMMIIAPGVTKTEQRCDTPVSLLDIYPTLLPLCGLPEKDGQEGTSLLPQLRNPRADRDAPAITTFSPDNHAVRLGHWRYIQYADSSEELYDHRDDPHEWNNLATDERHAALKQQLASHLPEFNKSHNVPSKWKLPDHFFGAASAVRQNTEYDLVVIEATPGGVACAVRAACEGLNVALVNRTEHLGGILSSGLGVWDTLWEGKRSPVYDELRQSIFDYYGATYGENSQQYRDTLPGKSGHTNGKIEPHVVENLITNLVAREPNITLLKGYIPVAAERDGRRLAEVTIRNPKGPETVRIRAKVFADCSYEGDLLPLVKTDYRFSRESRDEFDDPHAGKIYMRKSDRRSGLITEEQWKAHQDLPLRKFRGFQEILQPESAGEGDHNVQAFNYRTILTSDPANRMPIEKPQGYDAEAVKNLEFMKGHPISNAKIRLNRPQLVGLHQAYVEGDWETRQKVMDAHWNATIAKLYFLQNDPSVSEGARAYWKKYGLPKDEFSDNGHRPYENYVREGRCLDGRYVLTQHDVMPVSGTTLPPKHRDAIAMTDWYMDSHAVTAGGVPDSLDEGKMMLHAEAWPGQIPYRCLLPRDLDNLLVPVCLSSSHVAWGAIRLEPTWMQTGEAAGYAAALAIHRRLDPATIDSAKLVAVLQANGFLIDFYGQEKNLGGEE